MREKSESVHVTSLKEMCEVKWNHSEKWNLHT